MSLEETVDYLAEELDLERSEHVREVRSQHASTSGRSEDSYRRSWPTGENNRRQLTSDVMSTLATSCWRSTRISARRRSRQWWSILQRLSAAAEIDVDHPKHDYLAPHGGRRGMGEVLVRAFGYTVAARYLDNSEEMVRERYSHIEAGELGDVATEALEEIDSLT